MHRTPHTHPDVTRQCPATVFRHLWSAARRSRIEITLAGGVKSGMGLRGSRSVILSKALLG